MFSRSSRSTRYKWIPGNLVFISLVNFALKGNLFVGSLHTLARHPPTLTIVGVFLLRLLYNWIKKFLLASQWDKLVARQSTGQGVTTLPDRRKLTFKGFG